MGFAAIPAWFAGKPFQWPACEILVLKSCIHNYMYLLDQEIYFGLSFHLLPYIVYASTGCTVSSETCSQQAHVLAQIMIGLESVLHVSKESVP